MVEKVVDLNKSIYDLCNDNPEIIELLVKLGFSDVANPTIRNTAGRVMTLQKGAVMKKKNINTIKEFFIQHGYKIKED